MTKQTILLTAPVSSRSGYGNHSRDIALSIIKMDKYDLHIMMFHGEPALELN